MQKQAKNTHESWPVCTINALIVTMIEYKRAYAAYRQYTPPIRTKQNKVT